MWFAWNRPYGRRMRTGGPATGLDTHATDVTRD
jgi:hypothetical protein